MKKEFNALNKQIGDIRKVRARACELWGASRVARRGGGGARRRTKKQRAFACLS